MGKLRCEGKDEALMRHMQVEGIPLSYLEIKTYPGIFTSHMFIAVSTFT